MKKTQESQNQIQFENYCKKGPVKLGPWTSHICRTDNTYVGTPSAESQEYATSASTAGHIYLKDAEGLRQIISSYFQNVFIFSMNDEIVHTGFIPRLIIS